MKNFLNWLDDRTGYREIVKDALYENVPGGARWRYVWGSTLVFAFVTQMVTGFFLWAAYSANAQGAWESVYYIQHEMMGGWLLRGVHHFMAQAMVVLLVLHLMQVVIDGAYKAPREINFWLGLVLMLIVLGLSLTGYLLPWDQKGFWATKVATNIMGITPVVGPELQKVVVGGTEYGHHTLTRFFAIHAGLLPALLVGFLALHIYVFRRHGITAPSEEWGDDTPFWPDQVLKDAVACLAVLAVVMFFVVGWPMMNGHPIGPHMGADLGAPADPTNQYSAARPEWYFLFLFQLLKYFPGETEVIGAHILPGLVMFVIFLMPFLGKWKLGHRFNIGFLFALIAGVVALTALALQEDGGNPNYVYAKADAERIAKRMPVLVEKDGIRTEGAAALVRTDPYLRGPVIFAKHCASCHRYDGHNGRGRLVMGQIKDGKGGKRSVAEIPNAADLGDFGRESWWKATLTDFKGHIGRHMGLPDDEGMVDWSIKSKAALEDPKNADDVKALYKYLASLSAPKQKDADEKMLERGRAIATGEAELTAPGDFTACTDCHSSIADVFKPNGEDTFGPPDLAEYGSAAWLKAFISDPSSPQFYGEDRKGNMPAFKGKMTEKELDLLVRWMTGDYHQKGTERYESKRKELEEALRARKAK